MKVLEESLPLHAVFLVRYIVRGYREELEAGSVFLFALLEQTLRYLTFITPNILLLKGLFLPSTMQ